MICHTSDYTCLYHACMSNDCQKKEVLSNGANWGEGKCLKTIQKLNEMHKTRESIDEQQNALRAIDKEHPIIFSTSMVQAILEGRKTMTRRIVKEPYQSYQVVTKHITSCEFDFHYNQGVGQFTACPYGKPGDRLWVRETFCNTYDHFMDRWEPLYKADGNIIIDDDGPVKWKPSIHMPRTAARINLLITNIRVERLRNISESDSIKEGIELLDERGWKNYNTSDQRCQHLSSPYSSFESLWRKIYGNDSWHLNPWVWVIEFRRVK